MTAAMFQDRSGLVLLLSNLLTIAFALVQNWDLRELMIVYWFQSVIIGFFNMRRILDLKEFNTDGFTMNDRPVPRTRKAQRQVAAFFAVHYGFFHFVYLMFLVASGEFGKGSINMAGVAVCVAMFLANHLYSYRYNRERDRLAVPNLGTVMMFPYARIVPMHLTIVLGGVAGWTGRWALLLFLGLKTGADLLMHYIDHSRLRRIPAPKPPAGS